MNNQMFKIAFNDNSIFAKEKGLRTTIPVDMEQVKRILKSGRNLEYRKCDDNWLSLNNLPKDCNGKKHLDMVKKKIRGKALHSVLNLKQIGRAYYKNAISLSSLPRPYRQALQVKPIVDDEGECVFETLLYDYDLSNAQYSILYNILKKSKVPKGEYKMIKIYCKNRNKWLNLIKKRYCEGDKSKAKNILITLLNLGNLDYQLENIGVNVDAERGEDIYKSLKLLSKEMKNITNKYVIPNNKELYEEIHKKKGGDKAAEKAAKRSIISRFLQHYETQITEGVLVELMKQNIIKNNRFDYAYDGFLVPEEIDPSILDDITTKLGWNLKWTIKGAEEGEEEWIHILNNEDDEPEVNHDEEYLKEFDIDYFKNTLYGDYDLQKTYFEKFYTFVINPEPLFMFSRLKGYTCRKTNKSKYRRVITPVKLLDIKRSYGDVYSRIIPSKKEGGNDTEIPFIVDYMKDRFKNCKVEIEFYPTCSANPKPSVKNNYNMFQGYNPVCFEKGIKFDPKSLEKGGCLYDYLKVVDNVMGGKEEGKIFNFHLAHKILYPHAKPRTAICIISTEGVGKNVILTTNSQIFGEFHYISTTNLEDIIGTHAEGLPSKLVVNLNEINFADSSKKKDALKGIVSEERQRVNAKNVRPYDVDVYALIVATSNNNCCLCIDTKNGDRRWFVFESNELNKFLEKIKMANGKNRWDYLINKVWSSKKFIQQLYLYYKHLDRFDEVKNYDFNGKQREMSRSKAYFRLAQYCIPMTTLFLSNYIINCDCFSGVNLMEDSFDSYYNYDSFYNSVEIKLTDLHTHYEGWYMDMRPNGQFIKGIQQFKNDLDGFRFKSISFLKKKNATYIVFKPCYLLKELDSRKFVSVDFAEWDKQKMMGKEKIELVNPFTNDIVDF